ncbi:MAG: hypothetical protein WBC90_05245 [Albidovulum sp.]
MARWWNISWPVCALVALIGTVPAQAETVRIRSGEHETFTRLVVELRQKAPWQLGRNGTGYELRLDQPDIEFETGTIFARVPRTRLADVVQLDGQSALGLTVSCDCHAEAFEAAGGRIVIDMKDGPAPANSAFEVMLEAVEKTNSETVEDKPLPLTGQAQVSTLEGDAFGSAATITFRPSQNQDASLPIYWRGVATTPEPDLVAPDPPDAADADTVHSEMTQKAHDNGEDRAQNPADTLPFSVTDYQQEAAPPVLPPPITEPKMEAVESALLRQLSRAASQGLVTVDSSPPPPPAVNGADGHKEMAVPPSETAADPTPDINDHIAFHAETSMDRDGAAKSSHYNVTGDGVTCLADDAVSVGGWGDDRPAVQQLTEARAQLVGEFDKPDANAVEALAKLYLFFGMGAEARQALLAFGVEIDGAATLADLGMIMDDQPVGAQSVLHGMRECEGAVAIWAFLAAPNDDDVKPSDRQAVVRSFSGLPGPLRQLLGGRISRRLMAIGASDSATAVRNAMARGPESHGRVVGMINAELDLDQGKVTKAEAALDGLSEGNDALSYKAVMIAVQSRLERGEAIAPKQIESVAALAFEHRNGPDGPVFAHLEVIARAASGDFPGAFNSYAIWKRQSPDIDRRETSRDLFMRLAAAASDADFLDLYFGSPQIVAEAGPDPRLDLALARRLSSLGFAAEVRTIMAGEAGETDAGQMLLAKAAVDLFEPEAALSRLATLTGDEAETLRARAYSMLQDHNAAAAALRRAGADEAAGDAAWAAGDWAQAGQARAPLQQAVTDLRLTQDPQPSLTDGPASLERSKSALNDSAALRNTLAELLGAP